MKPLFYKWVLIPLIGLCSAFTFAQEYNSFEVRYQSNLRGDLTFIGNHILNRDSGTAGEGPNDPYNNLLNDGSWSGANDDNSGATNYNDYKQMQYIDVDGDPTTFSSSTATFTFPQANCNLIRYAGLYWTATYPSDTANGSYDGSTYVSNTVAVGTGRQTDFNQVKFSVPGGAYVDITADEVLFDGSTSTDTSILQNSPYACYADVTALVTALADPTGDYTVANVRATTGGLTPGGGSAAGWTLVIVYENPSLTGKLISTFDGFARVNGTNSVDINYSGFETIPVGPVNASLGAGTLEGDFRISGDGLSIEADSNTGFTAAGNASNPTNNFFNSNITLNGVTTTNRNPASLNTLGFDTDIFLLSNPANSVIPNGETGATFRFSTNGDQYYPFFNSFNIEVIEPNITLEKRVEDTAGNDITGAGVNLGQVLEYVLTFENIGNDDGTNYTIRDVLPINVTLNEASLSGLASLGITYTFDPATRTIVFSIPDNLIEENDPPEEIRMEVQVAENCFDFIDACTDLIQNLAYSTYQGVINGAVISDDPSVTDFDLCGYTVPGATNFLLDDLENCDFTRTVQLCGDDVILDAGDNFDSYVWYIDNNADGLIDAGDTVITDGDPDGDPSTLVVSDTGSYIVDKIVADPCKGFQEIIIVELFGTTQSNPITALINDTSNTVEGEILVCPNDGSELPQIFLCGLNDTELIQINIPDADSIQWQQLDEASCSAATPDCANTNNTCTWNDVAVGNSYTASSAGQYRLQINYQNGCFSRFYFNVFQNPLDPQYTSQDIICNSDGNITVTNMPADYEYQLVDATTGTILEAYAANSSFDIASNGIFRVEMRQVGVTDGCVFVLDNIGIQERNFQTTITTRNTDCNGLGEISISMLDVEPQYYYEISQGGTIVDTFGPSADNNYTFENLNPGTYDVEARTDDGCIHTEQVVIADDSDLDLTASISQHITCREGNIQMNSTGGQTPHTYAIWSFVDEAGVTQTSYASVNDIPPSEFQTSVIFDILIPGDYTFVVVDRNNCAAISNTVTIVLQPAVEYTTSTTDLLCFGTDSGVISINITNSNGYQVEYFLIDDAGIEIASNSSGTFTGLGTGDYQVRINQRKGSSICDYFEDFTISGPADSVTGTAVLTQEYTCLQSAIIEAQGVTGGTAPYEYSIDGVTFLSGAGAETFSGLTDGDYTITIRDANGCVFTTNTVTVAPLDPPTDLTFVASNITCPSLTSDITVTSVGGETPLLFEIIAPTGIAATSITGNSATFNGLSPNTYTFQVTDNDGCSYTEDFTIAPITPIAVVGQLVENISCFNDLDGAIRYTVSGFTTDYSYSVTGPSNFSNTTETNGVLDFTGLDDGTYTIVVTDNTTNCVATTDVIVEAPSAPLTLAVAETQPTCVVDGSVILTATGGWGGNSFEITYPDLTTSFSNSTGVFNNLNQDGVYTVSVTDLNGCVVTDTFTLTAAIAPALAITPNDFCYDAAVGLTLTATVTSGGDGNYEYRLNGGAYGSSNIFTGLGPGTYTIDVRDGNACIDSETITINPELSVVASAPNITSCATDTDVTITAAGGDGNYVFAIVADGTTPVAGDFSATNPQTVTATGDYDVYVRDNNGAAGFCEASFDITIVQDAPLALVINNTAILCSGDSTSTLDITASGGEAPYQYSLDNGATYQTSNTFVNLAAGSYNIRVQDANGCEVTEIYAITEPITLSASAGVTQLAQCNPGLGAEVRITNVLGGTSPYEYSFDGGSNYSNNSIDFLLPGTHSLFVRDANGCTFPMTVTVDPEPSPPNVAVSVAYECDGEGTITVTPDSAAFDYTYDLDGTPNTPSTSNVFSDVAPGNYTVTVNYTSNTPPTPSILLLENFGSGPNTSITEIDPAYCYEPQDGSASACGFGTNTRIQDGEYSVTQTIVNPYGSWLSPNDHTGNANGRFLAINVGGVAGVNGIVYAKRGIEVIPNRDVTISLWAFNLLRSGTSGGDPSIVIELVDGLGGVIASTSTSDIPKNNNANDWQNYSVNLNPGANTNLDIVIRTNSAVVNGNDIAIDDIQASQTPEVCSGSIDVPVTVVPGNAFDANITASSNISCASGNDGSIAFEVLNFDTVNGFEYDVNGGGFVLSTTSPINIPNLTAGSYTITVRDVLDNSCSVVLNQTLTEPSPVVATASITNVATCVNGAVITANASGGTPNYTYQLEDGVGTIIAGYDFATNGTNSVFNGLAAGDYVVRARDINGCEDAIDTPLTIVPATTLTFTTSPTACYSGASDASIQVDVTAGNGDYQFSLNGGPWITPTPATATTHTFNNLTDGTYTIDVRDGFGCTGTQQTITINPALTANAALTTNLTCLVDATITITANGGSGTYTYEWSDDAGVTYNTTNFTGNVFTTSAFGTFQFRVTDTTAPTACTVVTNVIVVDEPETPIITNVTPTNILCNGQNTGVLDVLIDTSVGSPPYTIDVVEINGPTNYGTQTTGLPAGDYEITITDANGCVSAPFAVSITEPNLIAYSIDLQPITCDALGGGTNPGSITVENVTGGTVEYTYYLTGNNGFSDSYTTTAGGEDYTFNILEFGIYEVDVVDANGCSVVTTNIIASPPSDLDIDVSTVTTNCAVGGTATVTVSSAVGSGNYQFAILETYSAPYSSTYVGPDPVPVGNTDTATFTGLVPGITYTFVVYDTTTMCYYFESAAAPINSPSSMAVTSLTPSNITCTGAADGNVSFTFDNFDATATSVDYEIFNAQSNVSTGFTGTAAVNPPAGPITVNNFGTLPQGVYYILLYERGGVYDGCSIGSADFTITESSNLLQVTAASPVNDNCNPNAGVITATAQFGTAPYEFQYLLATDPAPTAASAGWTSTSFANVESGNYTVYVKDAFDCIQSDNVTVLLDASPEISLSIVDECVAEGSFEVLVTLTNPANALPPFQISINGGAYQSFAFNGSNEYTVTGLSSGLGQSISVRDVNGCFETDPLDIQPPLEFTAIQTVALDCEPGAAANAEIEITVVSGSGNYEFEIDGPGANDQTRTVLPSNPYTWTGAAAAGGYNVTVYDLGTTPPNCFESVVVDIPDAPIPSFTETHMDVTCNGGADGSITLTEVNNGINPLVFTLTPMPVGAVLNGTTFENLPAGTYSVRGVGTNSCFADIFNITINEPAVISIPAPSVVEFGCVVGNTPNNASITIDDALITGGSGTYVLYEFINDQGTPATGDDVVVQSGNNPAYIETNPLGGSYLINVYDSNGCLATTTAVIQPFDELLTAAAAITNPLSCDPGMDGEITITVTSTNSDPTRFEYSIDNGVSYQASNVFAGLDAGTYNFLIRHIDTGCMLSASETITNPNTFTIDAVVLNDVVCFGTATGQVTFELLDATYSGPIDWEIFDTNGTPVNLADDISVATGSFATNGPTAPELLPAGSYYVEVTQANFPGCSNIQAFTIAGPPAAITGTTNITPITCLGNDGSIEITNVSGGWGGYTYFVGTAAPTGPGDYVANAVFQPLGPGTYQAWVRDVNGCEEMIQNGIILADPAPITASLQINQENCTNLEGEIEVVGVTGGQNGNYTYQLILNGTPVGSPQTSPIFSGLGAGSYEVLVADQWSCTFTTPAELLYEELNAIAAVIKPIDCSATPGGEITITVTGGSTNLDFTVTYPDAVTTQNNSTGIFTGLTQDGTYTFVVRDLDTNNPVCETTVTQALTAPTPVTFDPAILTDVSCFGGNDGSVTIVLQPQAAGINDNPLYQYNLYDNGGVLIAGPQNDPTFTGLAAANYEIEAVSSRSCSARMNITINQPNQLTASAVATSFVCDPNNTVNTAIITTTAVDGTAPYRYSIDNANFQTSNTFEIIDAGVDQNITVFIEDANGCTTTAAVTINTINTFAVGLTQNTAISCAGPEEILLSVTDNGNPANTYTFELLPAGNANGSLTGTPTSTSAIFELLAPGSYTLRVTDNATGCYQEVIHTIAPYDLIDVIAVATAPVICFGDTNGALEISVSGYTGTYSYEVFTQTGTSVLTGAGNTGTNPLSITGLSGGNYFVRVTQTAFPFCVEDSNIITIVSPDMALDATVLEGANVTCTNDQGEIIVTPEGGYAPYDVVVTNTTTGQVYTVNDIVSEVFTGLSEGTFDVQITDNLGCVINRPLVLTAPLPITAGIDATPTMLACYGDTNAQVSAINVLNGQGVYQYQLNTYDATGTTIVFTSGPQNSPVFNNLGAGIYSITVSDGWNCGMETAQVTISEPAEVMASLIQLSPLTCTTQAQTELSATGGTAPYEYSVDGITYLPMSGGDTHVFTVNDGVYQYFVRDSFGCEANISNQVSVDAVPPLQLEIDDSAAMINCTGEGTASIVANATGGLGNYSYELYTDAALTNLIAGPQTDNAFSGLFAGDYYVRATSLDCEVVSPVVSIVDPLPLQIDREEFTNVSCAGEGDGTITVEVSGGTGTILYAITPNLNQFDDQNVFTDLAPGIYDVIAQDENGCFITFQFDITEPSPLDVTTVQVTPEVCVGDADGTIEIAITGGTAPYRTSLNSNLEADMVQDQTFFGGLPAGDHVIFVRDAQDCETNIIVTVTPGVNLAAEVTPLYECTGNIPENRILVTLEDASVMNDVLYALDSTDPADMQLTADFANLAPGNHYLTIAHANGCIATVDFEIDAFEPLTLVLEQNNINEITAVATGGSGEYTFVFDGDDNGSDNTYYINRTDTFTVTVTDELGCMVEAQIFMEFIDIEIPNFFTPDGDNIRDFWIPNNLEGFPNVLIIIFDRYGRELYRMGYGDQGWNGIYNNSELPTGDYWYVIKLKGENDDREFVGHFTLYR